MLGHCPKHGSGYIHTRTDGRVVCKKCRNEKVTKRRRTVRELLVKERGGACERCGYNRCSAALQFHHRDPQSKEFGLSAKGMTFAEARMREEAAKCDLLCANCHAEEHHLQVS